MYISYVAKASLFAAVFSQLSIFTADCLRHPIQMVGVERSLPAINSCPMQLINDACVVQNHVLPIRLFERCMIFKSPPLCKVTLDGTTCLAMKRPQ